MINLHFSTVKILAQRPTDISARRQNRENTTVATTVLLITKTFIVKYYDRRI